jgi:hypothetical protein
MPSINTIDVPAHVMANRYVEAYGSKAVTMAIEQITYDDDYLHKVIVHIQRLWGVYCEACPHVVGRRSKRCFCPCHEVDR